MHVRDDGNCCLSSIQTILFHDSDLVISIKESSVNVFQRMYIDLYGPSLDELVNDAL